MFFIWIKQFVWAMRNNDDESSQEPLALKLFNTAFIMIMKDNKMIHKYSFWLDESWASYRLKLFVLHKNVYVLKM